VGDHSPAVAPPPFTALRKELIEESRNERSTLRQSLKSVQVEGTAGVVSVGFHKNSVLLAEFYSSIARIRSAEERPVA
jgi:hypothetical protein